MYVLSDCRRVIANRITHTIQQIKLLNSLFRCKLAHLNHFVNGLWHMNWVLCAHWPITCFLCTVEQALHTYIMRSGILCIQIVIYYIIIVISDVLAYTDLSVIMYIENRPPGRMTRNHKNPNFIYYFICFILCWNSSGRRRNKIDYIYSPFNIFW